MNLLITSNLTFKVLLLTYIHDRCDHNKEISFLISQPQPGCCGFVILTRYCWKAAVFVRVEPL